GRDRAGRVPARSHVAATRQPVGLDLADRDRRAARARAGAALHRGAPGRHGEARLLRHDADPPPHRLRRPRLTPDMQLLEPQTLAAADPEGCAAIADEERCQRDNRELIASENHASRAVREATASVMTNKYAEGYPGKRYYGGCTLAWTAPNSFFRRSIASEHGGADGGAAARRHAARDVARARRPPHARHEGVVQ